MASPAPRNGFTGAGDGVTCSYKSISELTQKNSISYRVTSDCLCSMVEMRVRARFEISDSNPDSHKCANFIKKSYLGSRGACYGGRLARIFFIFSFSIFEFF
jgi:hypothetical protein